MIANKAMTPNHSDSLHTFRIDTDEDSNIMNSMPTRNQATQYRSTTAPVRPRSRAIAIQPTRRRTFAETGEVQDRAASPSTTNSHDRINYDFATWRMYYRITDYRQKYPLSKSYYQEPERPAQSLNATGSTRRNDSSRKSQSLRMALQDMPPMEGEIFELDI